LTKPLIAFIERIRADLEGFTGKVQIDGKNKRGEMVFYQLNFHCGNLSKRTKQLIGWRNDS